MEGGADAVLDVEGQPALVTFGDDRVAERETLAGSLAGLLGREERIEDPLADVEGDSAAGVADGQRHTTVVCAGCDRDAAPVVRSRRVFLDRLGGVDHDVQDRLGQVAAVAHHVGDLSGSEVDVGHVLVLVAGDGERRLHDLVQILG